MRNAFVYWVADPGGYQVTVIQGCSVLEQYSAGNNPHDSSQLCPPNVPPVPLRTLRKWARDTAYQIARDFGISRSHVEEDISYY
jgi:hypothetical protein